MYVGKKEKKAINKFTENGLDRKKKLYKIKTFLKY